MARVVICVLGKALPFAAPLRGLRSGRWPLYTPHLSCTVLLFWNAKLLRYVFAHGYGLVWTSLGMPAEFKTCVAPRVYSREEPVKRPSRLSKSKRR